MCEQSDSPNPSQADVLQQCGRQFFSDLSELKSGAIKRLEDHLERSTNATIIRATSNRGNTSSNGMCQSFMAWAQTTARSFKGWFRRRRGPALPQHNAKPSYTSQSHPNVSGNTTQALHLMSCMKKRRNGKALHQDKLPMIRSDKDLFLFMRESVRMRRGNFGSMFSLRTIKGIELVKVLSCFPNHHA